MRVLLIAHGFPPAARGGAEIYAAHHAAGLARQDEVLVFARENDTARAELAVRTEARDGYRVVFVNNTFLDPRSFADSYEHPRLAAVFRDVVDDFQPEVAHVHHLTCLSTHLVYELARRDVPQVFTLHDYWFLCHRGQLLDLRFERCQGPGLDGCATCIPAAAGLSPSRYRLASVVRRLERQLPAAVRTVVSGWLRGAAGESDAAAARQLSRDRARHMRAVLARADRLLVPSHHLRRRYVENGIADSRFVLSRYGFERGVFLPRHAGPETPFRIGFIGTLMVSKAPHLLLRAAERLPTEDVRVHLFGEVADYHGDPSYRRQLEPLLARTNVVVHGAVPHERIAEAFDAIDLLVVPSIWEENSPLIIQEAFLAGVPVVAARLGGIPELIGEGAGGLLFAPGSVDDLARVLTRCVTEPGLMEALRLRIPDVRSIDAAVEESRAIYEALLLARDGRRQTGPLTIAVVVHYRTREDTLLAVRALRASAPAPAVIIIVNNDGGGDDGAWLGPLRDEVVWIDLGRNAGFSAGVNAGIEAALTRGAQTVFLVNSDVMVPPDCLGHLQQVLAREPRCGIAGPLVLERARPDVIDSQGIAYDIRTGRLRLLGCGDTRPAAATSGTGGAALASAGDFRAGSVPVDAVAGCVMLIDRRVFERMGAFDDAYFYGFEDVDLCLRARRAGLETHVAEGAVAYHEGGRSIGRQSSLRLYYAARNHLRLAATTGRNAGGTRRLLVTLSVSALNIAHAVRATGDPLPRRLRAVIRGIVDHVAGRYGEKGHPV